MSKPVVTLTPEELANEEPGMFRTQSIYEASGSAGVTAKRAALPPHLRLGVTLPGMRELLLQLPSDAVEQVNAKIPLDKVTGEPLFSKNDTVNGYVIQYFATLEAKGKEDQPGDGLAVCERLQERGSPHMGEATVFV